MQRTNSRKQVSSLEAFNNSNANAEEKIILDENKIADGHSQCVIRGVRPSPDHTVIGYSVDFKGDETYTVKIVDLQTNETTTDNVGNVAGSIQWGKDKQSFFYLSQDKAKRPFKLWKHIVGTSQESDVCLFTEHDEVFSLGDAIAYCFSKNLCYDNSEDLQKSLDSMGLWSPLTSPEDERPPCGVSSSNLANAAFAQAMESLEKDDALVKNMCVNILMFLNLDDGQSEVG